MKWQNKGHEFDTLGAIFKKNKNLLVIGNDESLKSIKEELDFLNTEIEYKTLKEVFSIPILLGFKLKNKTIVIADNSQETLEKLKKFKFIKHNENVFLADDFLKTYLSIYALYVYDKLYFGTSTCTIMTTYCPLNCKYCMNQQPYIKNKQHKDIDEIKKDIDYFFNCVDRVKYFCLSGGEPFLYPHLGELAEYVHKNYGNKIYTLWFGTSSGVMPSDELLEKIKKSNAEIWFDDYRKTAPFTEKNFEPLINKCKEMGIKHKVSPTMTFIKLFPPKEDYTKLTDEQLIYKYDKCQHYGPELRDGKLYACCYGGFAETAKLVPALPEDTYDLTQFDSSKKAELMEFKLYYTEKGYMNFCKYCNGLWNINNLLDENGVTQADKNKILEWDINNPTYLE